MMTGLERYIGFFESIGTERQHHPADVATQDIHFRDPFNDLHGLDQFEAVIGEMRNNLGNLKIVVSHAAVLEARGRKQAIIAAVRWDLSGELRAFGNKSWQVHGYSELAFSPQQKVSRHFDYWDAAGDLYENLPLIGVACRYVRRRLALKR